MAHPSNGGLAVNTHRVSQKPFLFPFILNLWGRVLLIVFALGTIGVGAFAHYYSKYARMVDEKLRTGEFAATSTLYAAPQQVVLGENAQVDEIASYLRRCGYSESNQNRLGSYSTRPDGIQISPGPDAYNQEGALITVQAGRIAEIVSLRDHTDRQQFLLEPETITNLFDQKREKRLIVHFDDIPKVMVNAILSAEDKRFFRHRGFDLARILRAGWVNLKDQRNAQGASTVTQQLARTIWLGTERGWRRKIPETLITMHLEHTHGKQQICEDYANAIYLGHQGSFSIQGFAKASKVYLGKDSIALRFPMRRY
jgi:hypothetical protein